ncbi:LolA family protein [Conservatibacter flavescens]|uniref:Outer membrane lipoprotein carrier protein LolA n=1 Tax=Conservatibacter flavescens TaxID=28161 RepID=A0A2M8S2L5_9PAST|nr:outer membrane lipoprotein carrier protein LolA [Conservatibacter flavescens]PJG85401.1 outer membrane lipoprotein carrier protein LolA [Conservatibacter flavescens]
MKKYLFTFLLLCSSFTMAFSEVDLMKLMQKPQSVQGEFVQQRFLKALSTPITTSGQFSLVKQKGLLWQMQKPFLTDLKVTPQGIMQWNGTHWISSQNFGQSEQIKLFLGLLGGDISALAKQFDTQLSGDQKLWQLRLIPNSMLMKQIFQYIQLQGGDLVNEIEIFETQGDRTVIRFNQLRVDQALPPFAQQALQ